jgi:hypothetical protein
LPAGNRSRGTPRSRIVPPLSSRSATPRVAHLPPPKWSTFWPGPTSHRLPDQLQPRGPVLPAPRHSGARRGRTPASSGSLLHATGVAEEYRRAHREQCRGGSNTQRARGQPQGPRPQHSAQPCRRRTPRPRRACRTVPLRQRQAGSVSAPQTVIRLGSEQFVPAEAVSGRCGDPGQLTQTGSQPRRSASRKRRSASIASALSPV